MKILSKMLVLILILVCNVCIFVGCTKTQDIDNYQLDKPMIYCKNGTIKWNKIEKAEKYEVLLNDNVYTTYNCYFDLPLVELSQNYSVRVKSISEIFKDSEFCEILTISAKRINPLNNFNLNISDNNDQALLTWTATNTDNYKIKINRVEYITNKTSFLTDSSFYVTGDNIISITPVGTDYDFIPDERIINVVKSEPLQNVNNIRIENGVLKYGESSVYDTSDIETGKTTNIILSNKRNGEIWSDGPSFEVYKVSTPYITHFYKNSDLKQTIVVGDIEENCDYVVVKIGQISQTCQRQGNRFYFYTNDMDIYYNARYVEVTGYKNGCINSNISSRTL